MVTDAGYSVMRSSSGQQSDGRGTSARILAMGSGIMFAGLVADRLLHFAYRVVLARMLGVEDYGLFSLAFSVYMVSVLLGSVDLPTGVMRYVSVHIGKGNRSRITGTLMAGLELSIPWSVAVGSVLFLVAPFLGNHVFQEPGVVPILRVFSAAIPFRSVVQNISAVFKGVKRMDYYVFVEQLLPTISTLGLTLLLIWMGYGAVGAAAAVVLALTGTAMTAGYLLQTRVHSLQLPATAKNHGELLRFSLPVFGGGILALLAQQMDTLMMAWIPTTTTADIGVYNAAFPVAGAVDLVGAAFAAIGLPLLSDYYGREAFDEAEYATAVAVRWALAIALPVALFLIMFAEPILLAFFGPSYTRGASVLAVLAVGFLVDAVFNSMNIHIVAQNRTPWKVANSLIQLLLVVPLSYVLISRYGLLGAGIAYAAGRALRNVLAAGEVVILLGVRPRIQSVVPIAVAAVTPIIAIRFVADTLFASVPWWGVIGIAVLYGILYAALFLALGGIHESDVVVFREVSQRRELKRGDGAAT